MGRFSDNNNASIYDTYSGLTWQKEDDGKQRTYDEGILYCTELRIAGYSDWRLPELEELVSIVERGKPSNINTIFSYAKLERYQTITGYPDYKWKSENRIGLYKPQSYDVAYTVDFCDGYETSYFKHYKYLVRAARGHLSNSKEK